ncbi:putative EKC/KEOPS complex, subunit Pcc1 protein [Trachipleistophora hominis]|uniref:Putative EKC/KEOPS complex, subunit Pcc1 protein n=1 Tax=Trachipleistophora hominis TaxID=72359 RepID=L7JX41_TRAHO|nr:putative EKC/KEOPS complex, subunit Pcc1 protein [Trachipleistophora hominis]
MHMLKNVVIYLFFIPMLHLTLSHLTPVKMDFSSTFRIKHKDPHKIKRILEVDKDFRADSQTTYDIEDGKLLVNISCSNLVSLKKSAYDLFRKLTLVDETIKMIEEYK